MGVVGMGVVGMGVVGMEVVGVEVVGMVLLGVGQSALFLFKYGELSGFFMVSHGASLSFLLRYFVSA